MNLSLAHFKNTSNLRPLPHDQERMMHEMLMTFNEMVISPPQSQYPMRGWRVEITNYSPLQSRIVSALICDTTNQFLHAKEIAKRVGSTDKGVVVAISSINGKRRRAGFSLIETRKGQNGGFRLPRLAERQA